MKTPNQTSKMSSWQIPFSLSRAGLYPLGELIFISIALISPFIMSLKLLTRISRYDQAQIQMTSFLERLKTLESFDLRDLKTNDKLNQLGQIPLNKSQATVSYLKFAAESSQENSKLRETVFSMNGPSQVDTPALLQILDLLYPLEAQYPPKDLSVRFFKLQNTKNLSLQLSLVKREPR